MTDDEPKRTRRVPGWADIPDMAPPSVMTGREMPGLAAIIAILDCLTKAERRRALTFISDRYALGPETLPTMPPGGD